MNYDPNLTLCGRMAKQKVRLTFGAWEYRKTMEVEVGGNCTGFTVIDFAVDQAYELLEQRPFYNHDSGREDSYAVITMENAGGDTLESEDDDLQDADWLRSMLIAAEILSIDPDYN